MPMFQDKNKKVYRMSFHDETVFFNLAPVEMFNYKKKMIVNFDNYVL